MITLRQANHGNVVILFMFQDNEYQDTQNVKFASSWV
jgi:hypothetical protein